MSPIFLIAFKDIKELIRDRFGLFWVLGWPIIMAILFGLVYSGTGKQQSGSILVSVVNEDNSEYATKFIENLKKREVLYIQQYSLSSSETMVRRGKLAAYLRLKKGFGDTLGIYGNENNLEIGIDPSRKAESKYLEGMVMQTLYETMQSKFQDKASMREMISKGRTSLKTDTKIDPNQKPVLEKFYKDMDSFIVSSNDTIYRNGIFGGKGSEMKLNTKSVQRDYSGVPRSAFEITFPSAILWGMIGCAAAFAISIVSERRKGTYARLRMSPISSNHILLGKGTSCLLSCFVDIIILLTLGIVFFHVRVGNPVYLAMAAICIAWCFVGIMMFVSVLGKTEQAVAGTGWAIFMFIAMFGGAMVPLMFMPGWMKNFSHISPVKWGIYALEGAIWRGFSFPEMLLPCGILLGSGLLMYLIGWSILKKGDAQ
jgi:ABC-2 type transport system permease protein